MGLSVAEVLQVTAMSVPLKRFSLHISLSFACRGDHLSRSGTLKGRRNRCHYRLGVYTDNMYVDTGSYICVRAFVLGGGRGRCGCEEECMVHFITSSRLQVTQPVVPSRHGYSTIRSKVPVRQSPIYAYVRISYFTCNHGR